MSRRRRVGSLFSIASLWLVGPWLRPAAGQLLGPEFQVNTYTTSYQMDSAVAADDSGNFLVAWASDLQDGSRDGIFGRRFDSAGLPAGGDFRVNSYTADVQRYPAVAGDGSGSFLVVWQSDLQDGSGYGVFGRLSTPSGLWSEFRVNSYTPGGQKAAEVAAIGPGTFVVVWQSDLQDGSSYGVFGQRVMSSGSPLGGEFRVNSYTTGFQKDPEVAADGSGNFVVVWRSYLQDGSQSGVFAQRFNSAGSKVGSEFRVNSYTTGAQNGCAVAADDSGNFVVVWQSYQDGSGAGVFGQRFDSAGLPVGSEFQVHSYTTGNEGSAEVAADDSGDFVVVWHSSLQDGSNYGVFGQRFDNAGLPVGNEFQVNTYTTSFQEDPAVAADGSGNFVVAWTSWFQDGSSFGVFGQRLPASTFADGFETADACAWSAAVGGGC